ncbi:fimbria/pilus outer membrane usher protein [Pantoea sp. AG702]|uniref:fimbria/pilus outer membrane usher protein n=1 Tax=Pantoea sp. AG702 TaxID=2183907 RepID=UPI000D7198D5|nr:fimbria/pilus outer membrane usher protein [Pantoea sp. AG702]PWW11036.1 outer membrane usher protein FimD/PapC [Pantoea sp. AG702]
MKLTSRINCYPTYHKKFNKLLLTFFLLPKLVMAIEFNADVLDVNDRKNVDLSRFSRSGYIMPGTYKMSLNLNGKKKSPEQDVIFYSSNDNPQESHACITRGMLKILGLKKNIIKKTDFSKGYRCLNIKSIKGMSAHGDLSNFELYIVIPQAYLEYSSEGWDPPSVWDDGVSGIMMDYNINTNVDNPVNENTSRSLSGYGTNGLNLGSWRIRTEWQGNYYDSSKYRSSEFSWNRFYAFRPIPNLGAKVVLGESYLASAIFDTFNFLGISISSDEKMLPPNLRGYAPRITGIAKTNAKITVSQLGRIIYQDTVPAGPFSIQNLDSSSTGTLDVKVEEQDGSVHTFQVNSSNVPYLTRPGQIRYKLALGKAANYRREMKGPDFFSGEFSWGLNNNWSLYGGSLAAKQDYSSIALGIGRDLQLLGALSFDMTQSYAVLPSEGILKGKSFRLNYSKRFEDYNSQITFAGYRFAQQNFMSMSQYLDARFNGLNISNKKELYNVSLSRYFQSGGLSSFINYSHQTFWNSPPRDNYNVSISKYFDFFGLKNLSFNISGFRTKTSGRRDDGILLSVSIPWKYNTTFSYDNSLDRQGISNSIGYSKKIDNINSYSVKVGSNSYNNFNGNAFYTHEGSEGLLNANASYQQGEYSSVGMSIQGGVTATIKGAALHRVNNLGGTRIMVDTDGVSGLHVSGYGNPTITNFFGKAVVADVDSYYRNRVSIDINELPDNINVTKSIVEDTLTEGAIGYRKFGIIAGEKAMVKIRLRSGTFPPFGAVVINNSGQNTGIISDNGYAWLTGIRPGLTMEVKWNGQKQCLLNLPDPLPKLNKPINLECFSFD